MNYSELFFEILNIIGTVSFALSGTMVAIQKQADLFGVLFLAVITATGGGILRDLLLGITPPTAFVNSRYVMLSLLSGAVLFFLVYFLRQWYRLHEKNIDTINNMFDALGLGAFSVAGVQVALAHIPDASLFFCAFLGMTTGVGGGLLRDIAVRDIPFVLKKRIYAVASILGSVFYCLFLRCGGRETIGAVLSVLIVFCVRLLATHYRWNLPKVRLDEDTLQK